MSGSTTLKHAGLRITPKRLALLAALEKASAPITAEELHAKVRGADLVTIYRNLQSLTAAGLVSEVRFKDASVRYERAQGHHHHLVCTHCGLVEELDTCTAPLEKEILKHSSRFEAINEHSLEFFGICKACAERAY